jgi:uncharacterized protein
MIFKKVANKEVVDDIKEYLKNFLQKNKNVKIAVGSDSLTHKRKVIYATIIALFYPTLGKNGIIEYHRGAHLLYHKEVHKGKIDMWNRLWKEVEMTMNVAEFINQEILENTEWKKTIEIHLDINPDEKWKSNKLFSSAVGMFESMGYPTIVKPVSWAATCAADNICK